MIKGIIAGSFDIIHPGYIKMFEDAKENCDILVIALHVDPTIERPEKIKPILDYFDRFKILNSIKYIDQIFPYSTEKDLIEVLKISKPDIRFLGDDYFGKSYTGKDLNIPIYYLDRSHKWSTTLFKNKIYEQIKNKT
jgi:glycerol-3-phosphate cytidylyltransferase